MVRSGKRAGWIGSDMDMSKTGGGGGNIFSKLDES